MPTSSGVNHRKSTRPTRRSKPRALEYRTEAEKALALKKKQAREHVNVLQDGRIGTAAVSAEKHIKKIPKLLSAVMRDASSSSQKTLQVHFDKVVEEANYIKTVIEMGGTNKNNFAKWNQVADGMLAFVKEARDAAKHIQEQSQTSTTTAKLQENANAAEDAAQDAAETLLSLANIPAATTSTKRNNAKAKNMSKSTNDRSKRKSSKRRSVKKSSSTPTRLKNGFVVGGFRPGASPVAPSFHPGRW